VSSAAIIPAAGSGKRLGGGIPKAFRSLGGRSMLLRAVTELSGVVQLIVVAVPLDLLDRAVEDLAPVADSCVVQVVAGAATRQRSVAAALVTLPPNVDIVLVHDAARPLMPASVARDVLAAVRAGAGAVIPVLPVADTIKSVDAAGLVTGTVDRVPLVCAQTPQGFRRDVLERAHRGATGILTDDAGLVEGLGVAVQTVPGSAAGFKITTPYDVVLAEALLAGRQ